MSDQLNIIEGGRVLRVLFIEDSADDMFFTVEALKSGGFTPSCERVDSLPALSAALEMHIWDIIISDHNLPGFTSFQALEMIKNRQFDIPFIIVSGVIGEETAVKAMKAGASDYVMKGALGRLIPSVERELLEAANRRNRRQAEKALRRSQYDLNDFFENAPIGLHWTAPDGTILRANSTEFQLLGYTEPEYLGQLIGKFFVNEPDAKAIIDHLHTCGVVKNYTAQMRAKNGAIKDVLINANALCDDGKFIRARWFTADVTEKNKFEKAVAFLGEIVESSEDAIIGTDLEGKIISWNGGAERMYGYAAAEAKGRSIEMLSGTSTGEGAENAVAQIIKGYRVATRETVRMRKDGDRIQVAITRSPIKDSQGRIIGISAIERDITLRKQEQQERDLLIQELSRALAKVKALSGLMPICSSCKKIRDDNGYWQQLESYLADHSEAEFTHGICPDCAGCIQAEIDADLAG